MKTNFRNIIKLTLVNFLVFSFIFAPTVIFAATAVKTPSKTGLVGYWNFNEGTGTQAGDISGLRNNGTLTVAPTWTTGKFGKGLLFNGNDTYVTIPTAGASATAGTISFWAYATTTQTSGGYLVNTTGTAQRIYFNYQSSNNISFLLGSTAVTIGSASAPLGKWHHVVGQWNGSNGTLYVDGVLAGSTSFAALSSVLNPMYVGSFGGSQGFKGIIDDVRFYNRVLSLSEVTSLYKSGATVIKNSVTTNLLGYWPLNGDYGDYSGRRNDFTVNGTCLSTSTDAVTGGISVTGWATCGTSPQKLGYLSTGNIFNSAEEFTFIAWVKGTGIFWSGAPTFWLQATASGVFLDKYTGSWVNVATGSGGGTSSGWRQVVVTKTSYGGIKIYSNTIEIASSTAQTFYTPTSQTVGRYAVYDDSGYHFTGKIDDVRLYNKVLSQAEINSLYKIRPATVNVSQNNKVTSSLIGLWSFDGKDVNWATGRAMDRSGNGNNGVFMRLGTTTSPVPGKIGQALKFVASLTNYVYVTNNASINTGTGDFSISVWYKGSADASGNDNILQKGAGSFNVGGNGWELRSRAADTNLEFCVNSASTCPRITATGLTSFVWKHAVVVVSRTNSLSSMYINGVFAGSMAYAPTFTDSYQFNIGVGHDTYYRGSIDDVRLYNRALSATEAKQLYNLGR